MKYHIFVLLVICSLALYADPPVWEPITGTEFSMILFARIAYNETYLTNNNQHIVAAFGPGGDEDCRCIADWQDYDPYGFWCFNIVGNTDGEMITFKFYNSITDNIYECPQIYEFLDNANIGSPSSPDELIFYSSSEQNSELSLYNSTKLNIYPNPFNPDTNINFNLKEAQKVNLSIYNLKGQRIINLINGMLPEGTHRVVWNGIDQLDHKVSSGIYLIKLSLPYTIITQKTLLLK
ncbi:MAG: T9SS type A sorting domain-containing protein [Candidatus Stygibacter frigidus]|nr:T9SS type A sorting domain-containing protein [Candidatus Stygibacter frigidus]